MNRILFSQTQTIPYFSCKTLTTQKKIFYLLNLSKPNLICFSCFFSNQTDIDECSTGEHKCSENAICTNLPGAYQCQCKQGYQGDGQDCKRKCRFLLFGPYTDTTPPT